MPLELWPTYILQLAAGILAVQSPDAPVSAERAAAYAVAATVTGQAADVDPWELIAIARNESDFVEDRLGPDGKDCGVTQTRVTISKYSCSQLRRSHWLAFSEAARELSEYNRSCRYAVDYNRCRFNKYNSGVRYARSGFHGNYYLRVMCFADAARAQVDPGDECRKVTSSSEITRVLTRRRAALAARQSSPHGMQMASAKAVSPSRKGDPASAAIHRTTL